MAGCGRLIERRMLYNSAHGFGWLGSGEDRRWASPFADYWNPMLAPSTQSPSCNGARPDIAATTPTSSIRPDE